MGQHVLDNIPILHLLGAISNRTPTENHSWTRLSNFGNAADLTFEIFRPIRAARWVCIGESIALSVLCVCAGGLSSRYGLVAHTGEPATLSRALQQLNADWYLNFSSAASNVPSGRSMLIYIPVIPICPVLTASEIQAIADSKPGPIWYVSGEPNIFYSVDDLIEDLRYYYTEIKSVVSTARITGPAILNWDFTCIGCGGCQSGQSWMNGLVNRYGSVDMMRADTAPGICFQHLQAQAAALPHEVPQ